MLEIDQGLLSRAMAVVRKRMPSCDWSYVADSIVADRVGCEKHLNKPDGELNRDLVTGLGTFRRDGVVVHPLKLEVEKISQIRQHLERLPVYGGSHTYSSNVQQRPLAEVLVGSNFAWYTPNQLMATPHFIDFLNHPAIVDFVQLALGCVPTLYSINAWWSSEAKMPMGDGNQLFHRDNDDWRFITLFLYLTDVDEASGPHQLIPGSQTLTGMEHLLERARSQGLKDPPWDALKSFTGDSHFGAEFSTTCERLFRDSIVNIEGQAGTLFMANTLAIHRGLTPSKTPRLVVWGRYGLGPNTNSVDLAQGPISRRHVACDLPDSLRNRYVNRLLFEFD